MPNKDKAAERTPLLAASSSRNHDSTNFWDFGPSPSQDIDYHSQFCSLVGIPSSAKKDTAANKNKKEQIHPKSLYGRVTKQRSAQNRTYAITASISNTLLLSQVVIGAAVTALGASESSHILITVFGALNTIIAGVVAYLKSRGQPMRARMFRDDLERVVDEIENSEVMWLGITNGVHGYEDIDIDKEVTVRSEVARLTRLYKRAVDSNTMNNPDMYLATGGTGQDTALRARTGQAQPMPTPLPVIPSVNNGGAVAPVNDPDESPATAPSKQVQESPSSPEDGSNSNGSSNDATAKPTEPSDNLANGDTAAPATGETPSKSEVTPDTSDDKPESADDTSDTPSTAEPGKQSGVPDDKPSDNKENTTNGTPDTSSLTKSKSNDAAATTKSAVKQESSRPPPPVIPSFDPDESPATRA